MLYSCSNEENTDGRDHNSFGLASKGLTLAGVDAPPHVDLVSRHNQSNPIYFPLGLTSLLHSVGELKTRETQADLAQSCDG
jgi:hypothetical protein